MRRTDNSPYDIAPKSLRVIEAIRDSPSSMSLALVKRMNNLGDEFDEIRSSTPDIILKLAWMYKSQYAYHTIALEGNTLSQEQTRFIIEQGMTIANKSLRENLEARNIPDALNIVLDIAKTPRKPLTQGDILDIHKLAMNGISEAEPGRFRAGFVQIGGTPYVPPPAYEVGLLIDRMLTHINSNPKRMSPIELAFKAHLWLVTVHPFLDGNGRVARLFGGLILVRNGYPPIMIRKEHRRRYVAGLKEAQTKSVFKNYYDFMAEEFISTLAAYTASARQESSGDAVIPLAEAAKRFGLDPEYLGLLARKGVIPALKTEKRWQVRIKDMDEYLRKRHRREALRV